MNFYQTSQLINTLQRELKVRKLTYEKVAEKLGITKGAISQWFTEQKLSLKHLEEICSMLDLTFLELIQLAQEPEPKYQLTVEEEKKLVDNKELLLIAFLIINGWKKSELTSSYNFEGINLYQSLSELQKMGLIELIPPHDKIKLKVSLNFSWIEGGPMHDFLKKRVFPEFQKSLFLGEQEYVDFLPIMASPHTFDIICYDMAQLKNKLHSLAREDANKVGHNHRLGYSFIFAVRQWVFSDFKEFTK